MDEFNKKKIFPNISKLHSILWTPLNGCSQCLAYCCHRWVAAGVNVQSHHVNPIHAPHVFLLISMEKNNPAPHTHTPPKKNISNQEMEGKHSQAYLETEWFRQLSGAKDEQEWICEVKRVAASPSCFSFFFISTRREQMKTPTFLSLSPLDAHVFSSTENRNQQQWKDVFGHHQLQQIRPVIKRWRRI